jgi:uncharacterized membrane protein
MTNTDQVKSNSTQQPLMENPPKLHAMIAYAALGGGLFLGLPWFVGGIWAILKKPDGEGSIYLSHYSNAIKTFWWGLGLSLLGLIFTFFLIGYILLLGVWLWSLYRVLNGFAKILADKPY